MNPQLYSTTNPVVFFPVRHHSPACARLVRELVEQIQPALILIEGPADFNDQLEQIYLEHSLPIAIYSYVRLENGRRRGAFYPFSIYSPEWQALQIARERKIAARFIDMPWEYLAEEAERQHRYSDGWWERSRYLEALCQKLGVDSMNDAWDTLFEIDERLTAVEYMERCHHYCYHLRATTPAIQASDRQRERFMAAQIRAARDAVNGQILVITGGFHCVGLFELLDEEPVAEEKPQPASQATEKGIALTPFSYKRLDRLSGYEAGMPSPGFYHQVWRARRQRQAQPTHRQMLSAVAEMLRQKDQQVSAADLIAVETTATALAQLRGHRHVWRQDLIDGILGALVKEELAYGLPHPFLTAVYDLFRGDQRGRLDPKANRPPLVIDIQQSLINYELAADYEPRHIELDLLKEADLTRSRILHRLRILGIPGYTLTQSSSARHGEKWREKWRLQWSPEFESACIEAAIYGPDLLEAARGRLLERFNDLEQGDAAQAAAILLDGALIGLPEGDNPFFQRLMALIQADNYFFTVSQALGRLLYLYRFDEALGTARQSDVGRLLQATFSRALWLLESLGTVQGQDQQLLDGVKTLLETFERCGDLLTIAPADFALTFRHISQDEGQTAVLRGGAGGVLWVLGDQQIDLVLKQMRYFAAPEQLGDFLTGLFYLAREAAQRQPALVRQIDELLGDYSTDQFLAALPALRLAFSFFTPREKHHLADTLFQEIEGLSGSQATIPLQVTVEEAARILRFEEALFQQMARYGLQSPEVHADG